MAGRRGWMWDAHNGTLEAYVDGTEALTLNDASPYVTVPNGLTVTAGGLTVTAGGATVTAGTVALNNTGGLYVAGPFMPKLTVTDVNAQNNSFTVAQAVAGIVLHTSATGGGTVTLDTAAHFIAGSSGVGALTNTGQSLVCYYVNDGDQTLTFADNADGKATVADTGNTIATNTAATVLIVKTAADSVKCYIIK